MATRPRQAEPRPQPRLYVLTPPVSNADEFAPQLAGALGAADIAAVLLRLDAGDERPLINCIKAIAPITQERDAALLLDGHGALVARGGADGAHLTGIEAFSAAIEQLRPDRIVGVGGLASRHDAMQAAEAGADYVMFGHPGAPLAATEQRVAWAAELFELPCVAYAGNIDEIPPLIAAGADFIAVDFIWTDPRGAVGALADTARHLKLPEPA
jgi:thiamine-phosphate pyrophosphorylase